MREASARIPFISAEVAELADALRSGRSSGNGVWVRLPPSALERPRVQTWGLLISAIMGPMADKRTFTDKKKRGGSQISGVQVMFAAILSIGLILAINFSTRISAGQPLQEAYNRVQTEIAELQAEQADLTALRNYVRSDAYVEQWARDDGKMIRPGEVLVVPVPSGRSIEATPAPQVSFEDVRTTPDEPEPWMLWWQLFFDNLPPDF